MKTYDLVFEGGGAKGSVFVGALEVFFTEGEEREIRCLLGTSAGAITAALLAAGFTPQEMLEAVNETLPNGKPRFSTFMDIPNEFTENTIKNSFIYAVFNKANESTASGWLGNTLGFFETKLDSHIFKTLNKLKSFRGVFSFIERGGIYSGDTFVDWMEEKLNTKTDKKGNPYGNMSLKQLYDATGSDLSLVITDTKDQLMRVLNYRTAPDCPVKYAVRMSMSIPFVWQEVHWDKKWGKYLGQDITGNTIVDGGVLSNFPINLLNNSGSEVMGENFDANGAATLGFLIDETLEVASVEAREEAPESGEDLEKKGHRIISRITRLVDTMTGAHDQQSMLIYQDQICRLPAKGYGTTEFDMSGPRLEALIEAGRREMRAYLAR